MRQQGNVAVVGAGIAGIAISILLAKRGHAVELIEKRGASELHSESDRSINLALSARGLHALQQLGALDDIAPELNPMRGRLVHQGSRHEFHAYDLAGTHAIYSVRRSALTRALLGLVARERAIHLRLGTHCSAARLTDGLLDLVTADGRRERLSASAVIGADGVNSAIRGALLEQRSGAQAEITHRHDYAEVMISAREAEAHQLGSGVLHLWPGRDVVVVALPNVDASLTATVFFPAAAPAAVDGPLRGERLVAFLEERLPDCRRSFPALDRVALGRAAHIRAVRCSPWHHERAILIGDAAHAMEPFLGQGANAALEDCVVLMACVEDAGGDFREAFASFFERRKPDADAIGLLSTVNYHEMGTSVTTARFQSARRLEQQLQQRHPERFVPQYALIAFHRIPYAQARARGELQARLIGEIVARQERGERLEMAALDAYVCDHLAPLAGPASPIQQPSLAARPPGPRATELKAPAVELEEH